MRILVLHGPNLNLFGRREPHIYGTTTLPEINAKLERLGRELEVELIIFQSNLEGVLVDKLHEHIDSVDGAIVNPAGLTQYGVSLHDAIKAMPFPVVEVHMTNLAAREEWRHRSIISSALKGTVLGLGWRSYTAALRALVEIIAETKTAKEQGHGDAFRGRPARGLELTAAWASSVASCGQKHWAVAMLRNGPA